MNLRKLLQAIGVPLLLLLSLIGTAQDRVITGKVTDASGKAISNVSVSVKGQTRGTTTNDQGIYTLSVPANASTIVVSSIGYSAIEMDINGRSTVDVSLRSSAGNLNEVVVIAYGTRRRGDLTGSVTSISSKDFQKGQISSSEQLLQGKVAGLEVTTGGGSAGGGSKIRIRGGASLNASNDPLIVIDGVPVDGNRIPGNENVLGTINPDDIESISVLKDASATALYGSRASNGVIIITTKKGTAGKVRFNFNTRASIASITKKVDVLTGDQVRDIITKDATATGINTFKNLLGTANTDWQDQIYQKAFGIDNNLSASGTAYNIPFRASIGYLNQNGILKTNNFNRLSGSLNLTPRFLDDHLMINLALKGSYAKNRFADENGAIGNAVSFDPTQPVYATNKFGGYYEWLQADGLPIDLSTRNPLALLELRDNRSRVNRFIGNVQVDYKLHFFPDLHVLLNFGMDRTHGEGDDNIDSLLATNYKTGGRKTFYQQTKQNSLADVSLLYNKELKNMRTKMDLLVGHSYQDFATYINNYPSFSYRAIASPASPAMKDTIANSMFGKPTDTARYRLESYLARVNFTIADKYLITASIRRDASSKFGADNRVGYFPAVAVAWKLREEFFANSPVVNNLKIRASWGETGQQDGIDYYSYLPYYVSSLNTAAQYQLGNTFYTFLRPSAYDRTRKWESTQTTNIGLDFGFLNNRISGSVDVYRKLTKDLLSRVPVPAGANFDVDLVTNVGNMENKGIEFTLNTTPVKNKSVTWDFGFNVTYNKTEITNLLKQSDPNFKGTPVSRISGGTGNNLGIFQVGYAPYTYYVYKQVYDQNGKPIEGLYEDLNRDGAIDANDLYFYKKPAADVLLGFSSQVSFKQFTFSTAGHGQIGNYVYNNYFSNTGVQRAIKNPINFISNVSANYLQTGFVNNQYLSDYFVENASFFRLDHITVDYNFGKVLHKNTNLRATLSVQNVFIITKYRGLDPEISAPTGIDNNIYPRPRTYVLGLSLDF